jgi:hypothetical protein
MKVKNKYVICSRISEAKFRQIILLFSEDLSATQISHLTKLSRQTINTKFKKQLNQKTPLPTTQIFNKTILT